MSVEELVVSPGTYREIVKLEADCARIESFDSERWEWGLIYILGADRVEEMKARQEQGVTSHQLKVDWSAR